MNVGIRDGDEGPQVKDFAASFHGFSDTFRILQVSPDDFQLISNLLGQFLQETQIILVVPNKSPDFFTLPHQFLGQVASDEPSGTRH